MARIAIFHSSALYYKGAWQSMSFYDGIIGELVKQGNDVLQFITNDFLIKAWNGSNAASSENFKEQVHNAVKDFKPDLVITFNNSNIDDLGKIIDCPIVMWEADSPLYFNNKDEIRRNPGRYHYFAFSEYVENDFIERFGAPRANVFRVKNATAIEARPIEQEYNISFIGTCFRLAQGLNHYLNKRSQNGLALLKDAKGKNEAEVIELLQKYDIDPAIIKPSDVLFCRASEIRLQTLSAIAPLGLKIFGDDEWRRTFPVSIDLATSYDDTLIFSLQDNALVYNRSKLAVSISHPQAITGYPWRILDILASNAVLVSDPKQDLINDFGSKVPLQLYQSPSDLHDMCKRLLNEPTMRSDVVAAAHEAIDQGYRWLHRFREIEQILSLRLISNEKTGSSKLFKIDKSFLEKALIASGIGIYDTVSTILGKRKKLKPKSFKFPWLTQAYYKMPHIIRGPLAALYYYRSTKDRKTFSN